MAASNSIDELLTQLEARGNSLTDKLGLLLTAKTSFESKMINDLHTLNQKITELDLSNYVKNKESFKLQQQQLQAQTQALQTANAENTRLKSDIVNNRQLIDEQTRQFEAIKTELNTQKGQVSKIMQEKKSLETINASIMAKNRELQPIIVNLKIEIQNLETQLLELPGLKNGKEQLTQQINDLTQQLSQKTTEYETNSQQLLSIQQQIAANAEDKQRFEKEKQTLTFVKERLEKQNDELLAANEQLTVEKLTQEQKINNAKTKLTEINQNLRQQIERIDVALIKNQNGENVPDELINLIETIKQNLAIAVVKGGNKQKKIKRYNTRRRSKKTNKKRNKSNSKRGGWVYKSNEKLDSQSSEITTNSGSDSKSRTNSNVKGEGLRKTKKRHSHYKSKAKSRTHKMQ
jgi:hypothetical protein